LLWLWLVDGVSPDMWDLIGVAVVAHRHGDHRLRAAGLRGAVPERDGT
jgi:drug/metabolite transporter superfamily protein YnfA